MGLTTVLGEWIPRAAPLGCRMTPRCGYAGSANGVRAMRRPVPAPKGHESTAKGLVKSTAPVTNPKPQRGATHDVKRRVACGVTSLSAKRNPPTEGWGESILDGTCSQGGALVVLHQSREAHRPVHGATREAVIDLAFMPGKTGADSLCIQPRSRGLPFAWLKPFGKPRERGWRKGKWAGLRTRRKRRADYRCAEAP